MEPRAAPISAVSVSGLWIGGRSERQSLALSFDITANKTAVCPAIALKLDSLCPFNVSVMAM